MTSTKPTPGKTPMEVPGDNHEQGHSIADPVTRPGQQQQGRGGRV